MIYGYCRISTTKQSIERQIRNILKEYPQAVIYQEEYTGTKLYTREQLQKLLSVVKSNDTIVFDSVSRMSRNAEEGYSLYMDLYNKGINLVFLKEPHINTATYQKALHNSVPMTNTKTDIILKAINEYLLELAKEQIVLAFKQAEKEVKDLQQRTKEGLQTAKNKGKSLGRVTGAKITTKKSKPIKDIILNKSKDFKGHNSDNDVISIINGSTISITQANGTIKEVKAHISRNTFYKYKRELVEELS